LDATIEMSSVKKLGNRRVRVEMQKGAERVVGMGAWTAGDG